MLTVLAPFPASGSIPSFACSTHESLCLQLPNDTSAVIGQETLREAERLVGAARGLGLRIERLGSERGALSVQLEAPLGSACARSTRLAEAIVEAAMRPPLLTGAPRASIPGLAIPLVRLLAPCDERFSRADEDYARRSPAIGWPADDSPTELARASSWFDWFDRRLAASPGALLGLFAMRSHDSDPFALLRTNTGDALFGGSSFDDLVLRFAIERHTGVEAFAAAPVWHIPWPAQPRRLLLPTPLSPYGSASVDVDPPRNEPSRLRMELEWEQHATLRVAILALDAEGHLLRQTAVPVRARDTRASFTLENTRDAHRLRIVLLSLGDPLEPPLANQRGLEAHGVLLSLAAE